MVRFASKMNSPEKGISKNDILESEDILYSQLCENILQEMFILDSESLQIVAANRATRVNLGYTLDQLRSLSPSDIVPEFINESFQNLLKPLFVGERKQIKVNTLIHRRNGTIYPAEIIFQLFDYAGKELCMALVCDLNKKPGISIDVLEREQTLTSIIETARDAIVVINDRGNVILWNHAAEQLFGYSKGEIQGKDLHHLLVPNEHDYLAFRDGFTSFLMTGTGSVVNKITELKAKRQDGRVLDIELSLSSLRSNNSWYAVGIVRDISEWKQSRLELENSKQQYAELAENAPVGILSCDTEGRITFVNHKVLEIMGSKSIKATMAINLLTFPLLVNAGFSKLLGDCLQKNLCFTHEMNYLSAWGKRIWLRFHIQPHLVKDAVAGALIIIDDITKEKQLEENLVELSITDFLTNTYNRRYFLDKLNAEIDRSKRTGRKFSLIMMDIDHFKKINDRYGHNTGDQVLKRLAEEMQKHIRKSDTLARWGGEEFTILLPETPIEAAVNVAEKLRKCISGINITGVETVNASFGAIDYCPGDTADMLIQKADQMLYRAKESGRNCVKYLPEID